MNVKLEVEVVKLDPMQRQGSTQDDESFEIRDAGWRRRLNPFGGLGRR